MEIRNTAIRRILLVALFVSSTAAHAVDAQDKYLQERKKERDDYVHHLQTTWAFDVINRIKPQVGTQTIGRSTENDMVIGICPD